jgi:hypothetical protein
MVLPNRGAMCFALLLLVAGASSDGAESQARGPLSLVATVSPLAVPPLRPGTLWTTSQGFKTNTVAHRVARASPPQDSPVPRTPVPGSPRGGVEPPRDADAVAGSGAPVARRLAAASGWSAGASSVTGQGSGGAGRGARGPGPCDRPVGKELQRPRLGQRGPVREPRRVRRERPGPGGLQRRRGVGHRLWLLRGGRGAALLRGRASRGRGSRHGLRL